MVIAEIVGEALMGTVNDSGSIFFIPIGDDVGTFNPEFQAS